LPHATLKHTDHNRDEFVHVRGARQHNLRNLDVDIPRERFVVFTGVSGSGKSSLAFGTIYAEAQRRYFDSIAPYARRLIDQLPAPRVREIRGLPPAVALLQRRAEPNTRSSVGTLTKLSNSLRMLFSRVGTYPSTAAERLDSDSFSPNTVSGACPECHGIGVVHTVSEQSLVPDPSLTIREGAIAAWPGAWQGKNFRDILATLGYDVDRPWRDLPAKDREWILFTKERPVVTVYAKREAHRIQRPYQGTYMSASEYVLHTFSTTQSQTLRKRVLRFMDSALCSHCNGKRLRSEVLAVKFAGFDIAELSQMPLSQLTAVLAGSRNGSRPKSIDDAAELLVADLLDRIALLTELGLDHLSLDRPAPTLSAGELQRLRLTTQLRSGLFGVVYVLDEPSAGLHPSEAEALLKMLRRLNEGGNSLFVVEHDMLVVGQADWVVDLGPGAGDNGGQLLYSGPLDGLRDCSSSLTREYLFADTRGKVRREPRVPQQFLRLSGISRHNIRDIDVQIPLGVLTAVSGVSGSGKSTLISQVLFETITAQLGRTADGDEAPDEDVDEDDEIVELDHSLPRKVEGGEHIKRLVSVDQKPIGRTPRSNLATYTGLFDHIRKLFAATDEARARGYNASRFSFNVVGGRCSTCEGQGFVSVELMFLPSIYAPCSACGGSRYNDDTLAVTYNGLNIAQVLDLTVDAAAEFFASVPAVARALKTVCDVGLGYLHLGQPATELSGGEAQRIKLATELQRTQSGTTLYLLDEPTTGLHPADVEKLVALLQRLVDAGNSVVVVEHDLDVLAACDWIIDMGPGAGSDGGKVVAAGAPSVVAASKASRTAPFLRQRLSDRVQR
jgi:excinuclease ABC subunit A